MSAESVRDKLKKRDKLLSTCEKMRANLARVKGKECYVFLTIVYSNNVYSYENDPAMGFQVSQFGPDMYEAKIKELEAELARLEETFKKWEEIDK